MNEKKSTDNTILPIITYTSTVTAITGFFLPVLFFFICPDFNGKLVYTVILLAIISERFWFSLFTSKEQNPLGVKEDWTFIAVGFSYTLMIILITLDFYLTPFKKSLSLWTFTGAALFSLSFIIRRWAAKTLGRQWAIHLESSDNMNRQLIQSGPYALCRHPIYCAAMIEVLSIPLLFQSYTVLFFSIFVCIPLQIKRTKYEETISLRIFGDKYRKYMITTRAFWPFPKSQKR